MNTPAGQGRCKVGGHPIAWSSAQTVARPFVAYPEQASSPVLVWHEPFGSGVPRLSVVIPTSDGERGGYFQQLLRQISNQSFQEFELIVVRGDPRQGRAINVGAALARGEYLMILDDDTALPDPDTVVKLLAVLAQHPDIGLAGGNNVVPADATPFVRRVMREIPRRSWEPVQEITDSDLAEHPCLIMRLADFKAVGGENELLPRGLDPYLRHRFRESGKRVVVAPGVIYHHLPPGTWTGLVTQCVRNGRAAAFVNRYYPQWVLETPATHGAFPLQVPFPRRATRYLTTLGQAICNGRWVWLVCQVAYAIGFVRGWLAEVTGSGSRKMVRGC